MRMLNWKRDKFDIRDFKFSVAAPKAIRSVYLTDLYKMPVIYDQLNIGSCTANGINGCIHYDMLNKDMSRNLGAFRPSRLFTYYYERAMEGTVNEDAGACIRDGIKVVADRGIVSEDIWPYEEHLLSVEPSVKVQAIAKNLKAIRYERLDNTNKGILVNALLQGFPIVFGMDVFESFMSEEVASSGIVPMPGVKEQLLGGHAMMIVGYSLPFDSFIVRNSWGTEWGQKGYCRIPASYLCNPQLATDFWVVYSLN